MGGRISERIMVGRARRWAALSVVSNSALVAGKLVVGILGGSIAIIAEALHSGLDLVASVVTFFAVRISAQPADKEHPYGHGKFENLGAMVEALLILVAAGIIVREAVGRLTDAQPPEMHGLGTAVMAVSALVNWLVSGKLFKVARETDSIALEGDAWHLRTDVWSSVAVAVGVALVWVTDWHILDPLCALVVALLIGYAGLKLVYDTTRGLTDVALPKEQEGRVRAIISSFGQSFYEFHGLRTRKSGRKVYIDFHLVGCRDRTLGSVHALCDDIERALEKELGNADVTIHVEPCSDGAYCADRECSRSGKTPEDTGETEPA
jgi:cation diffusion facilitator family transporter